MRLRKTFLPKEEKVKFGKVFSVPFALQTMGCFGILLIVLYGLTGTPQKFIYIISQLLLLGFATFMIGMFVGFLFGIPKNISKSSIDDANNPNYTSNTNLEEISDWLTKIIVGLGLTQLAFIPGKIKSIVEYLSRWMLEIPHSIIISVLAYFVCYGFFAGYLITRLYLAAAFSNAEDNLKRKFLSNINNLEAGSWGIKEVISEVELSQSTMSATFDETGESDQQTLMAKVIWQTAEMEKQGLEITSYQYFKIARIMFNGKNYPKAKEYYLKSFNIDRNYKAGSNAAVTLSKYLKQFSEAEALLKDLLKTEPQNALIHYNLACNYVRMGEAFYPNAIDSLKSALTYGGEEYIEYALTDDTFNQLIGREDFKELLPTFSKQ